MRKGRSHIGYQHNYKGGICQMCGEPESMTFAGMETAVEAQAQAAAVYSGQELTAKLLEPLGSIDSRAGLMEERSPLFYGKINPTLF